MARWHDRTRPALVFKTSKTGLRSHGAPRPYDCNPIKRIHAGLAAIQQLKRNMNLARLRCRHHEMGFLSHATKLPVSIAPLRTSSMMSSSCRAPRSFENSLPLGTFACQGFDRPVSQVPGCSSTHEMRCLRRKNSRLSVLVSWFRAALDDLRAQPRRCTRLRSCSSCRNQWKASTRASRGHRSSSRYRTTAARMYQLETCSSARHTDTSTSLRGHCR